MNIIKNSIKRVSIDKAHSILSYLVLATVILVNSWFLFARSAAYIDSDMASNVLAAVNANSEHVFLSKNWYYSTGIDILSDIHVFQIVLPFFRNNWMVARTVAVVIMQLMLAFAFIGFSKEIGLKKNMAILFSAFAIAPASYWLLLMVSFGSYYTMPLAHALLTLILIYWLCRINYKEKKKQFIICILLMITEGVVRGLNGIKGLIYPYAPILLTAVILIVLAIRERKKIICLENHYEISYLVGSIISIASYMCGFIINSYFFSKKFDFENKNDMSWAPLSISNILAGLSECLSLLGYQSDEHVDFFTRNETVRSVFSLQGIANLFGLLIIGTFIFSIVRLFMNYKKLSIIEQSVIILLLCSLFVGCVIFKLTQGYDTSAVYWVPMYPLMLIVIAIEIKTESFVLDITPKVVTAMLVVCFVITSISTIKLYEEAPMHANPQLVNVAKWLEDNGYTQGYGTFWQCNSVTLLTNGNIDMWNVYGFDNLELDRWLQKKSHETPPTGDKIFALIGPKDEMDREVFLQYMNTEPGIPEIVYQDDEGYIVVEYKK